MKRAAVFGIACLLLVNSVGVVLSEEGRGEKIVPRFGIFPSSEPGLTINLTSDKERRCSVQVLWPSGVIKKSQMIGQDFVAIGILGPVKPHKVEAGSITKEYAVAPKTTISLWDGAWLGFNLYQEIGVIVQIKFAPRGLRILEAGGVEELRLLVECKYAEGGTIIAYDIQFGLSDIKPKDKTEKPKPPAKDSF